MEHFRISIRKMWSVCTNMALIEKYFEINKSDTRFCCMLIYSPSKSEGNRTNFFEFKLLTVSASSEKLIDSRKVHSKSVDTASFLSHQLYCNRICNTIRDSDWFSASIFAA